LLVPVQSGRDGAFTSSCDIAKSALAAAARLCEPQRRRRHASPRSTLAIARSAPSKATERMTQEAAKLQGAELQAALGAAGYPTKADPARIEHATVLALLTLLVIYVTMVYGPIAAWLVELFPTRIRYTSMSLPYHIGNGWFGGFLPTTAFAMVAATGNIY
jgi:hypothetical protein